MKNLFGNELCNTGRQIEFDIAKAICILGMVFVHSFEELTAPATEESVAYYIMIIVLDALFGAATFMSSMGLGIAYTWKEDEEHARKLMKRGVQIFFCGYLLNICRYSLFELFFAALYSDSEYAFVALVEAFGCDIMPFAGLSLFLFGFLKKQKLSDKGVIIVALAMSVLGSFVRFIKFESYIPCLLAGLFVGTENIYLDSVAACFPLLNWFIIVVGGYLYGKALRHCKDTHKYYSIALPISGAITIAYLLICIPNEYGMMNSDIFHYYFLTPFDALFCFVGMILATSVYHFLSLALGDKTKKVITRISSNINRIYCIHWVIIGFVDMMLEEVFDYTFSTIGVFIFGCLVYIISNILAEAYTRHKDKKRLAQQN